MHEAVVLEQGVDVRAGSLDHQERVLARCAAARGAAHAAFLDARAAAVTAAASASARNNTRGGRVRAAVVRSSRDGGEFLLDVGRLFLHEATLDSHGRRGQRRRVAKHVVGGRDAHRLAGRGHELLSLEGLGHVGLGGDVHHPLVRGVHRRGHGRRRDDGRRSVQPLVEHVPVVGHGRGGRELHGRHHKAHGGSLLVLLVMLMLMLMLKLVAPVHFQERRVVVLVLHLLVLHPALVVQRGVGPAVRQLVQRDELHVCVEAVGLEERHELVRVRQQRVVVLVGHHGVHHAAGSTGSHIPSGSSVVDLGHDSLQLVLNRDHGRELHAVDSSPAQRARPVGSEPPEEALGVERVAARRDLRVRVGREAHGALAEARREPRRVLVDGRAGPGDLGFKQVDPWLDKRLRRLHLGWELERVLPRALGPQHVAVITGGRVLGR